MTDERLAAIKERADAATPGPWDFRRIVGCKEIGPRLNRQRVRSLAVTDGLEERQDAANAEFIAHAREDVPFLLSLVESLTAERERLLGAYKNRRDRVESLRDALRQARDELAKWGWGDHHYGSQGQEQSVVDVLAVIDATLAGAPTGPTPDPDWQAALKARKANPNAGHCCFGGCKLRACGHCESLLCGCALVAGAGPSRDLSTNGAVRDSGGNGVAAIAALASEWSRDVAAGLDEIEDRDAPGGKWWHGYWTGVARCADGLRALIGGESRD